MKTKSVSQLKKLADKIFSLYIRQRDIGICFTCGKKGEIKEMQCGHYVPRSHNSTRYHEKNNHCQCVGCNIFRKGNLDEYAIRLIKKYGKGILEELHKEKNKIKQWNVPELEKLISAYKLKVKE